LRKTLLRTNLAVIGLLLVVGCASAYAIKIELGGTSVSATAEIAPRALPAHGNAPVTIRSVTRLKATDGGTPPALKAILFQFDKHGSVDTKGLPTCNAAKLAGTTVAQARKRCAGAIVGEGLGRAKVNLPNQPTREISSKLTFFNAPPVGGQPALIAHGYETVPTPQALLVPMTIERVNNPRYGFRVKIELPSIAGGYGSAVLADATIGKTWKRGGKTVGYVNASCQGGRLQVQGSISLVDGSFFPGTLVSPCHVAD